MRRRTGVWPRAICGGTDLEYPRSLPKPGSKKRRRRVEGFELLRFSKLRKINLPRLLVVPKRRLSRVNARDAALGGSRPGRGVADAMPHQFGQMSLRMTGGYTNPVGGQGGMGFPPANSGCVKDGPARTDTCSNVPVERGIDDPFF